MSQFTQFMQDQYLSDTKTNARPVPKCDQDQRKTNT